MSTATQQRTRKRRTVRDLVLVVLRARGPLSDKALCAICRAVWKTPDSTTRGARSVQTKAGRVGLVGRNAAGEGMYDIAGIRRRPAVPPAQKILF
jgi:hypothetical protein